MVKTFAKLSAVALLMFIVSSANADSFYLPVQSSVCEDVVSGTPHSEIRYKAYDKAALIAVKNSQYLKEKASNADDHSYSLIAYRLVDRALNDVTIITTQDDDNKVCLELSGILDKEKADEILRSEQPSTFEPQNIEKIAKEINATYPKSMFETDDTLSLIFIRDIEFYNQKKSSAYVEEIAKHISAEPRVLVTKKEELADYIIIPKLLLSKSEAIDNKNSRFSMSVSVELHDNNGILLNSAQQNRYIIVNKEQDLQIIAQKLLIKLVKEALNTLSPHLKRLLKR